MYTQEGLYIGKGARPNYIHPRMANRHGLIAGATGTGKTVTLRVMAESFSDLGVPVFMADIKGDLSGIINPGQDSEKIRERLGQLGIEDFEFKGYPTAFWDVFAERGIPVRTTISDMGPILLGQILELNDTQQSVLEIVFRIADDQGLLLIDYKDLKSMIAYVIDHAADYKAEYGNLPGQSLATIQRRLIAFEADGFANLFFGEPALTIHDLMKVENGQGVINLLRAEKLYQKPALYATFLLWLMSELFEQLPEAGDLDKPKLVFFFDEAHLLFKDAPKALLEKIEQVVRLIRSKGVGIYFITQSPSDIPDAILGQLGNRVQHALRAYTPKDQKVIRAAADSFRSDGTIDVATAITELKVGQALISFLDQEGLPSVVDIATILPPMSFMGPAEEVAIMAHYEESELYAKYKDMVDRESAYEILTQQASAEQEAQAQAAAQKEAEKQAALAEKEAAKAAKEAERAAKAAQKEEENSLMNQVIKQATKAATSSIGRQIGQQIVRGILGSLFKK